MKTKIYEIRGKKVILDRDLAKLCGMETKVLNQKVKRHIKDFEGVYFQLTKEEYDILKSQIVTSSDNNYGGIRKLPYVFTEIGVEKLSVLFNVQINMNWEEKVSLKEYSNIEEKIYEIRGKQVMLDYDVAFLFGYEVKQLNRQVQRNKNRFPDNYCFQLTTEEFSYLRCQFGTSSYGGRRYLPYAFTEHGITMLAGLLKSEVAVHMSLRIVDTFIAMRKYIGNNLLEQQFFYNQVMKNTEDIKTLQEFFQKFEEKKKVNEIYFEGQIYSAYSKLLDIMIEAKERLIIVDRYADKVTLDMISRLKVEVVLIIKKNGLLKDLDIRKYNEEFHNLKVVYNDSFHDRYIVIDNQKIYHLGASINHSGSRTCSINILEDEIVKESLFHKIKELTT